MTSTGHAAFCQAPCWRLRWPSYKGHIRLTMPGEDMRALKGVSGSVQTSPCLQKSSWGPADIFAFALLQSLDPEQRKGNFVKIVHLHIGGTGATIPP